MRPIFLPSFCVHFGLLLVASSAFAATPAQLDQEYEQVRKIALRDPKVRASFDLANDRLEAKIVEIDPALKGYAKHRAEPAPEPAKHPHAAAKPAKPAPSAKTHTIATGDTLSSVAAHYRIGVADLKAANPKADERKLQVGDTLAIPGHGRSAAAAVAKPQAAEPTAWEKIKEKF